MEPKYGRLNGPLAWCGLKAKKTHHKAPFFQVSFGQIMNVSGLATQGLQTMSSYYVKSYTIKFSLDGHLWFNYSSPNKVSLINVNIKGTGERKNRKFCLKLF